MGVTYARPTEVAISAVNQEDNNNNNLLIYKAQKTDKTNFNALYKIKINMQGNENNHE